MKHLVCWCFMHSHRAKFQFSFYLAQSQQQQLAYSSLRTFCGNGCGLGVSWFLQRHGVQPASSNPSLKGCSASAGGCRSAFLGTSICFGFQNEKWRRAKENTWKRMLRWDPTMCWCLHCKFHFLSKNSSSKHLCDPLQTYFPLSLSKLSRT